MSDTRMGDNSLKPDLKSFVERIENLEEEKQTFVDDIKEVYAEAKTKAIDVKTLRKVIVMRRMNAEIRRMEMEQLRTYLELLEMD